MLFKLRIADTMDMMLLKNCALLGCLSLAIVACAKNEFSAEDRDQIMQLWKTKISYSVENSPRAKAEGTFQVRLTPSGSKWLHTYYRALGYSKVNPSAEPTPRNDQERQWSQWINAKFDFDRYRAAEEARRSNAALGQRGLPAADATPCQDPGQMPEGLDGIVPGPAPVFAECVVPHLHKVTFPDGRVVQNEDNSLRRPRYLYYRFSQGVNSNGVSVKSMPRDELNGLFRAAGVDDAVARVMQAVSLLEGGFDSINTYDTGFVSAGVIQFASLKEGGGSLGEMLIKYKRDNAKSFFRDFERFGITVTDSGLLAVIDPKTGDEKVGPAANDTIINDPRLAAVFQYSGLVSREYKVAQIKGAYARFYPANDSVTVTFADGAKSVAKVCDIIKSEAGLATLMDRKVNTGRTDPFATVVQAVATEYGISSISELASLESVIIERVRYRRDYLADATLSQPRSVGSMSSRGGDPKRNKKP
jgi:hypothetical protein